MAVAEGIDAAVEVGLEGELFAAVVVALDAIQRQGAVFFRTATGAAAAGKRGVALFGTGAFVVEFAADAPVVVEVVFEFEEGALFAVFAFVPVGAKVGFARQAQVAVVFGERQAVRVGGVVLVLVEAADGEFGVFAELFVEDAVESRPLLPSTSRLKLSSRSPTATTRPRTPQSLFSVPEASPVARTLPKRSTMASARSWVSSVGFLRTALMVPPGSLLVWVRPVAPRTTSMWS